MSESPRIRLDKWLWAARFFKTRALAQEAVDGGRVHYEGQRCKSSREVRAGARLEVTVGFDTREVIVTGLSEKRGNATQAAALYEETPESVARRTEAAEKRRAAALSAPVHDHRPDKHERRQLERLRRQDD